MFAYPPHLLLWIRQSILTIVSVFAALYNKGDPPLTVCLPICCSTCPPLCFWGCPSRPLGRLSVETDGLNCRSSSHSTHPHPPPPPPPPPPRFTLKLPLRGCSECGKLRTESASILKRLHSYCSLISYLIMLRGRESSHTRNLWFHPRLLRLGEWEHFTLITTPPHSRDTEERAEIEKSIKTEQIG